MDSRWILGVFLLWSGCSHADQSPALPSAPTPNLDLQVAITAYHTTGDPWWLVAYVARHDDPESLRWREVVAYHAYLATLDSYDDGWFDDRTALQLLQKYPETHGAELTVARSEAAVVRALDESAIEDLARFVDGELPEPVAAHGASFVDLHAFRERHTQRLSIRIATALAADGCQAAMGVCTWWVERYPDRPETAGVRDAMQAVWRARKFPAWKNRRHHRCAYQCGSTCERAAAPLDDSCYSTCYATCG